MRFDTLSIKNFGSIGEMEFPLLDQGLTLILGRNEDAPKADSNGAGKSLSLDAFTWALWGETVRGFSTDDVIHNKVGKNCKVTVTFFDDGHNYAVSRLRNNQDNKNYKINDLILLCDEQDVSGSSIVSTQEMIKELLGLDFITFCAMMPGAGITVATMTDSEVKSLLEKLLRTEVLSKASEEARTRHKTFSEELMVYNTELKDLNTSIEEIKVRIDDLEEKQNDYSVKRSNRLESLDFQIGELESQIRTHQNTITLLASWKSEKDQKVQEISDIKSKAVTLKSDLNKSTTHYQSKIQDLEKKLAVEKAISDRVATSITNVDSLGDECPTCSQEIDEHCKFLLKKELKEQESIHNEEIFVLYNSILKTEKKKDEDEEEFLSLLKGNTLLLKTFEERLKELEENGKEVEEAKISITNLLAQISILTETKEELETNSNPYSGLLNTERDTLEKKELSKSRLEYKIAVDTRQLEILSFWVDSFSPSGIRSFMLEHITPILNQYAKKYADLVTSGEMDITFHTKDILKSGKTKERFNIQVSQKHGGDSYSSSSAGERARANLVIALALGELAAMRADKIIPFRFLDEPFEAIDESGVEAIVALLTQQKERYNTVYVITHQDYLTQVFQNKLTIVKKDGYSTLERK
jgi:DNA repair exonuclease SbcCD ATPase subunit